MRTIFLIVLFLLSNKLKGQDPEFKAYLSPMKSVEHEEVFINSDLIDSLVKDKQIILLGELDHGDGTSFEIKSKMVKYLHKKHNFNVLVFESGLINSYQLWNSGSSSLQKNAKNHIYNIWSEVSETENLFKYIEDQRDKENSLQIVGIDPQLSGRQSEEAFLKMLKEKLDENEIHGDRFKEFSYELKLIGQWMKFPNIEDHQIDETKMLEHISYFRNKILTSSDNIDQELWNLFFDNIIILTKIKWSRREGSFAIRDRQMFENLKYWVETNEDQKFIVWAANAHIIRKDAELKGKDSKHELIGIKKLGDHIFNEYSDQTYSIAFSARKGKTLNFIDTEKINKIGRHKKGSLEDKLKNIEIGFVDLKLFEASTNCSFYEASLFYPNIRCKSQWSKHFDGVIYYQKVNPSQAKW